MSTVAEIEARSTLTFHQALVQAEAQARSTLTFHQALVQAEAQARSTLDVALHERLSAATSLVKDGRVFQTGDGTWQVDSASQDGLVYTVNGSCSCDDHHYNKPRWCKHQLGMYLAQRVSTLMRQPAAPVVPLEPPVEPWPDNDPEEPDAPAPAPAPTLVPLPEAPVSITLKASLHGYEALVTLRGTDFASVQMQVEQAAAWLKSQTPSQAASSEGWCPIHNMPLKETTKNGQTWRSHRTADGWCKGK